MPNLRLSDLSLKALRVGAVRQVQQAQTTLAKASKLTDNQLHYGSQMPDGDLFSAIDLALNDMEVL